MLVHVVWCGGCIDGLCINTFSVLGLVYMGLDIVRFGDHIENSCPSHLFAEGSVN